MQNNGLVRRAGRMAGLVAKRQSSLSLSLSLSRLTSGAATTSRRAHPQLRQQLLTFGAACACLGLLALAATLFVVADLTNTTYATTSEATINLSGDSYVTISASDVVISLTPDSSSSTAYAKTTVTLESSSTDSVQLYLSMSGSTTSLYKDGDTSSSSPAIDATTTANSLDNLPDNTWGYSLDNTTYRSVPAAGSGNSDNLITEASAGSTVTQDIYYGIKVSSSLASGTYSNSVTYTATVNSSPITATVTYTKIEVDGEESDNMVVGLENAITVTTNIKTDTYGEPRVYYKIDDGSTTTYQECSTVSTSKNEDGYLTITCTVTPTTTAADDEVTLYITAKGGEDDYYCTEGIYSSDSSDCEAGNWKWGTFEIELPEIKEGSNNVFGITYMQDMTTSICAAADVGDTAQLIDIRDNKTYWVAKLADENCWMTQDLDFDLVGEDGSGSSVTLDSGTSNITSDDSTTFDAYFYTSAAEGTADNSLVQTWDLGEYVILDPTNYYDFCDTSTNLSASACSSYFADVSGSELEARNYITDYSDDFTATVDSTSYDAHYLIGNYYSWDAATAGSDTTSGEAADSICPAGWQLPLANSDANGSFYYLLDQYGLTDTTYSGDYDISLHPLYFVRGGWVDPYDHYLYYAGNEGAYWSRVADSASLAYALYFLDEYVYSLDGYYVRYRGTTVRCIAV